MLHRRKAQNLFRVWQNLSHLDIKRSNATFTSSSVKKNPSLPEKQKFFFYVNGKRVTPSPDPTKTLIEFLRESGLTGTKLGCGEGGCGACTVTVSEFDKDQSKVLHKSVNSCIFPLMSAFGCQVTTVEGIGTSKNMHPVQEAIAKGNGSQCGYCTPGFVMSLYTLSLNNNSVTKHQIEECFDGNLCRCTGYRPILEAAHKKCTPDTLEKIEPLPFPEELKAVTAADYAEVVQAKSTSWLTPKSLNELLALKSQYPDAKIMGGNTELGIETKDNFFFQQYDYENYIDPALIKELSAIEETQDKIKIGSFSTLTSIYNYFRGKKDFLSTAIAGQLRWFSGTQIRNVATLGGNIVTASPISDLNPLWIALNCELHLMQLEGGKRVVPAREFFLGYRKVNMKPKEILTEIVIPKLRKGEIVRSFKQARRREDDIAIVNAGIRMLLGNDDMVKECSIAFGGVAPFTKIAQATEKFLIGKKLTDIQTIDGAMLSLSQEFSLKEDVPGGMPHFRTTLTMSFLKKFILGVQGKEESYEREEFKFEQVYMKPEDGDKNVVGHPMMHNSAKLQVTGEATYVDDLPTINGTLHAGFVYTTIPHGKIKKIDAQIALKMPGVKAFYSYKDIPGENGWGGTHVKDDCFFVKETVECVGQLVGVVVGDSEEIAKRAAKLVQVDYEIDQQPILSIADAVQKQSFLGPAMLHIHSGDVTKAFADCDRIVEGEISIGGQEHFYFETMAAQAVPGENDELTVYTSSQNVTENQHTISSGLNIPSNKIVCKVKRIGGGFGGKETRSVPFTFACALAARQLKVPVRCHLDRDVDIATTGQRHPFYATYKAGILKGTKNKLHAVEMQLYANGGWSHDLSIPVLERALTHVDNCYKIDNIHVSGRVCKTHLPSNTAFRGFGGPQGMFVIETVLDHISCSIGQENNKTDLRRMLFYKENEKTHYGQKVSGWHVPKMWDEMIKKEAHRQESVDKFNQKHQYRKRGIAFIPTKFGVAFGFTPLNQGGCLINIYLDGTVLITHGGIEMGQGLHVKVLQVVQKLLECPYENLFISESSTDKVPNTSATAASMGSDIYCAAAVDACEQINSRLQPFKKAGLSFKDIVNEAWLNRVNLSAQGFWKAKHSGYQFMEKGEGNGQPYQYYTQGVACSEVEVDCLTGDHVNLRSDVYMDVGNSINPAVDIGQIEGAFTQGFGLFTIEEVIRGDKDHPWVKPGFMQTRGPGNYKLPSTNDIPIDFRVHLMKDVPNPVAIMRSKAVGEPPLFLGSSVFFAIKEAIYAARRQHGITGYFQLDAPATCERIRMACADNLTKTAIQQSKSSQDYKRYKTFHSI